MSTQTDTPHQRNSRTRRWLVGLLLVSTSALHACTLHSRVPDMPNVSVLYESQNCGIPAPALELIKTSAGWDRVRELLYRANPLGPAPVIGQPAPGDLAVLVAWGQKPNASYRLALIDTVAKQANGTLVLPIAFIEPDSDNFAAQMLVSPCTIVAVSGADNVRRIEAGDMALTVSD